MNDEDNDGRFPDDSAVEIRYPRSKREERGDRSVWPWLPGSIVEQCGPDEWYVCVEVRDLAVLRDGRQAPHGTDRDSGFWWQLSMRQIETSRTLVFGGDVHALCRKPQSRVTVTVVLRPAEPPQLSARSQKRPASPTCSRRHVPPGTACTGTVTASPGTP